MDTDDPYNMIRLLSDNYLLLTNHHNLSQNYRSLLRIQDSLGYVKCSNLQLTVESKMNYIGFKHSTNISVNLFQLVAGVGINGCSDMEIRIEGTNHPITILIKNSKGIRLNLPKTQAVRDQIRIRSINSQVSYVE